MFKESFLLDPDLMDDETSGASDVSTGWGDFEQRVTARDGACVMTGAESNVTACHVIPHSKGDKVCFEYLLNHSIEVLIPSPVHH